MTRCQHIIRFYLSAERLSANGKSLSSLFTRIKRREDWVFLVTTAEDEHVMTLSVNMRMCVWLQLHQNCDIKARKRRPLSVNNQMTCNRGCNGLLQLIAASYCSNRLHHARNKCWVRQTTAMAATVASTRRWQCGMILNLHGNDCTCKLYSSRMQV